MDVRGTSGETPDILKAGRQHRNFCSGSDMIGFPGAGQDCERASFTPFLFLIISVLPGRLSWTELSSMLNFLFRHLLSVSLEMVRPGPTSFRADSDLLSLLP